MFGVSPRQKIKIENGILLIPERMSEKLICNGMVMIYICEKNPPIGGFL